MSRYLRHFTAVGDEKPGQWVEEELHVDISSLHVGSSPLHVDSSPLHVGNEELHVGSEELSPSTGQYPAAPTFRDSLKRLFTSDRFQIAVVCLVILDAFFVMAELLIDLSVIKLEHDHVAPQVFHYLSLTLLTFFMVELAGKLFVFRLEFFHHKFEVFDAVVVIVSFVLDIVFIFHEDAFDGVGLLILLRLWRVARIINGILVSVKTRADQKMHKLKESYDHLVERATKLQKHNDELAQENQKLQALLTKHGIKF